MDDPLEISSKDVVSEAGSMSEGYDATQDSQAVEFGEGNTFSYESLKSKSSNPVTGINYKRREVCLYMFYRFFYYSFIVS